MYGTIRLPACFLSVLAVGFFADFLRHTTNTGVALFTALLLATDAPFIFTNIFDWGPVCLLLLSTALFLYLSRSFVAHGNRFCLGAAFFVAGLATWEKALFVVFVAAMTFSGLVVFWKRSREWLRPRNVLVAILAFIAGAAPLIVFNLRQRGATIAASRYLPMVAAGEKIMMLRRTLDGRALEHYMFRSLPGEKIPLTGAPLAELVTHWYEQTSLHPGSLLFPALILALIALPFLRMSALFQPLLFGWIALASAETAMLFFRDAGVAPHHTVLLYPAPQFIVAGSAWALMERTRRLWPVWVIASILVGANLWLLRSYYSIGRQNGFSVFWTDGDRKLSAAVASTHLPVAILDWGVRTALQIETRNHVAIVDAAPVRTGVLYVGYCAGFVIDESRSDSYRSLSRDERIVTDSHGEPLFCIFEIHK